MASRPAATIERAVAYIQLMESLRVGAAARGRRSRQPATATSKRAIRRKRRPIVYRVVYLVLSELGHAGI